MSLSGGDNVDIMSDMYYKFLVHDCMWSGTCKEDNTHETTNKFSDFSYFSTSPVYGSIFDIFNIDDENSLGELNCDPGYTDTSDQDDSPLNGLSAAEDTEIVDDSNLFSTPSCSSSSAFSTSTLTGSTISPAGLLAVTDAPSSSSSSTSIKPANSRASTGKSSGSTTKSTLSSKATKSASSKANSNKSTISVATVAGSSGTSSVSSATTSIATSIVTPIISPSDINSVLSNNDNTNSPPVTPTIPTSANSPTVNLTAVAAGTTTSILKNTGKSRNSKSLYPERRKEHNNSEKKRRDHLRNAFNHLRDQIPKLKDGEKKAARVTILKESVSYVTLLKEKHRYLERTKNAETIKHENLLKRLKMLQSSTGATFINSNNNNNNSIKKNNDTIDNDSNLVYVQQCNSSTVC